METPRPVTAEPAEFPRSSQASCLSLITSRNEVGSRHLREQGKNFHCFAKPFRFSEPAHQPVCLHKPFVRGPPLSRAPRGMAETRFLIECRTINPTLEAHS